MCYCLILVLILHCLCVRALPCMSRTTEAEFALYIFHVQLNIHIEMEF